MKAFKQWLAWLGACCLAVAILGTYAWSQPARAMFLQSPDQVFTTPPVGTVSNNADDTKPLTIVTRVVAPFVIDQSHDGKSQYTGYSKALLDLMQADLIKNGDKYQLTPAQQESIKKPLNLHTVPEPTAEGLIKYVERGEANAAIASISITGDREGRFDYSMPIFNGQRRSWPQYF